MDANDLKCGICLELFQDPRSLPCLHTFCRECIKRSLNEENHSLKCPVCRAKHELSEGIEGAGLLPVNQYALQELPLKRLQQQREDNGGPHQLVECKSCGEQAGSVVAWCEDCDAMICQQCLDQHKKMSVLREHGVKLLKNRIEAVQDINDTEAMSRLDARVSLKCLRHSDEKLKYFCISCSELVCPECLLFEHKDHQFSSVSEARHSLETTIEETAGLARTKKQEFGWYLENACKAEVTALEHSELMKSEVNNVFDGIVASVEAQRKEALQSVSQGVKEIWSQKEMMEVSLAQLDSFTRYAENTHKCTTDTGFVSMATQAIKLIERMKDKYGDQDVLDQGMVSIVPLVCTENLIVPLNELFVLGQLSLNFSPAPCSTIECPSSGIEKICLTVSFMAGGQPVISKMLRERCSFLVSAEIEPTICVPSEPINEELSSAVTSPSQITLVNSERALITVPTADSSTDGDVALKLISLDREIAKEKFDEDAVECSVMIVNESDQLTWKITIEAPCLSHYQTLVVRYRLTGIIASENAEVTYKF